MELLKKIEEVFLKLNSPKKIAVAVSGGSDSLALTLLLAEFCKTKSVALTALTVDHKTRVGSTVEAKKLNQLLKKLSIEHQILESDLASPPSSEVGFRELRYRLLQEFCASRKIRFLFLGHTLDDTAENFLIRLFRGSGVDGLSPMGEITSLKAMQPSLRGAEGDLAIQYCCDASGLPRFASAKLAMTDQNELTLVRPLLNFTKLELQQFLKGRKIKWFEDPTNQDEKFLRNKIRKFLASFEDRELIAKRIISASNQIAELAAVSDDLVLSAAKKVLRFEKSGYFILDLKKFAALEKKFSIWIPLKILASILMKISNKEYKPRLAKLQRFYREILTEPKPRTFYHAITKPLPNNQLMIYPEVVKKPRLKTKAKNL